MYQHQFLVTNSLYWYPNITNRSFPTPSVKLMSLFNGHALISPNYYTKNPPHCFKVFSEDVGILKTDRVSPLNSEQ